MRWRKKGLVYVPRGDLWWARTYALLPTADVIDCRTIRVYFASLDDDRYGRIGYVDLDADDPVRILHVAEEPVLDIGDRGMFDDSGVNPSCVIQLDGKKYLYYIGWQRCERVPYALFVGLAVSKDGRRFERISRAPVFDRIDGEPFLRSAPVILSEGDRFRAWYVSGLGWIEVNGTLYPTYVIRHAESVDGVSWQTDGHICIDLRDDEFGIGRPWILRDGGVYRMWYSIRSRTRPYRIGYAESQDGVHWARKDDEVGIAASESGWDSEMICYPCVVDANGKRYMFYNGNRHGSTGFGCAVLES